jgi:putative SOS response-associated peptidase YedK
MCGRYGVYHTGAELAERFLEAQPGLFAEVEEVPARYNAAPTDTMPVIRSRDGSRVLEMMRWGLVPYWSKDLSGGARMINARAETLVEKPAFRNALERRRCLVPASGFYEWLKLADGRQPVHVRRRDGAPMALAGLWEEWRGPDGPVRSYTIVTTSANELMAPVHDRMPAILTGEAERRWLDPGARIESLLPLLGPCANEELILFRVGRGVNKVGFDEPGCIEPVPDEVATPQPTLFL